MIKPSHYDDDGYPIQWVRSAIPSNTLACLNALAEDACRREVLGPNVELRLHTYDETNRRVRPDRIIRLIRKQGGRALIGLVGVQSNQFPRSVDLARPFLAADLPVCIGGFHVSGCTAMLPELPPDIRAAQAMGISFFAGECEEGRLDEVLQDAWNGKLKPLYNHMDKLPTLTGEPPPFLPRKHVRRTSGSLSSIDLGRGCPYQCSFCTIINVQGRKSRFRTPDDLKKSSARTIHKALNASSSPMIILRAIAIGNCCLIGSSICARPSFPALALQSRSIRCATRFRISSKKPPKLACAAFSSDLKTSTPTTSLQPRNGKTRSLNTARCCRSGAITAQLPTPAIFLVFLLTQRNGSPATSR